VSRRISARIAAALGAVLALGAILFPTSGAATFPGRNGEIVFSGSDPQGSLRSALVLMRPDGTGVHALLLGHAFEETNYQPSFSASGRRVVFGHAAGLHSEIHTIRADGTGERRVTKGHHDDNPVFSGSGKRIVFDRSTGRFQQKKRLYSIRADGSHLRALVKGSEPALSATGHRLAFVRQDHVYVARSDGTHARLLAEGEDPSFSPDSSRILYAGDSHTGIEQVYSIRVDGKKRHRISANTALTVAYLDPVYSPSGGKVLVERDRDFGEGTNEVLVVMSPTGPRSQRPLPEGGHEPDWGVVPGSA
jgi:Tol biopolymer transport system component